MPSAKVAVSMDPELLSRLDRLVRDKAFASRSQAIQMAVREKIMRIERSSLASQCAKLDPKFERDLANQGLSEELSQWPEY